MHWTTEHGSNILELQLRHNPVIIRVNEFNEQSAADFSKQIGLAHNTGQDVIPIVIDSYGGQVYSLMSMIASIKASTLPIATIVEGKAMSCGVLLASCGTKGYRYVTEDATLMIHDVSSMQYGKNAELQASADETKRLNEKIYKILDTNCGKDPGYFNKEVFNRGRADWFVTPEEAIEIGLTDHIKMPKFHIISKCEINFVG